MEIADLITNVVKQAAGGSVYLHGMPLLVKIRNVLRANTVWRLLSRNATIMESVSVMEIVFPAHQFVGCTVKMDFREIHVAVISASASLDAKITKSYSKPKPC
jgi:hypothetical protein